MDSFAPRCQSFKGFGKRAAHPRSIFLGVTPQKHVQQLSNPGYLFWLYNPIWERQALLQSTPATPGSVGADAALKWPL